MPNFYAVEYKNDPDDVHCLPIGHIEMYLATTLRDVVEYCRYTHSLSCGRCKVGLSGVTVWPFGIEGATFFLVVTEDVYRRI